MSVLTLRPATVEDARYVGAHLREADAAEVLLFGVNGVEAAVGSLKDSLVAECLFVDGKPAAIVGIGMANVIGTSATPWMLTTEAVERHPVAFARASRRLLERAFAIASRLENVVDARYTKAIRWLEWLGFTVEPEQAGLRNFWKEN